MQHFRIEDFNPGLEFGDRLFERIDVFAMALEFIEEVLECERYLCRLGF